MRKAKRIYSRRERALRAALIALALLLYCNGVLHLGFLLPAQETAFAAQYNGVYGPVKTVAVQWKRGMMHFADRLSLVEGENSLSLHGTYLAPYGWEPSFLWPVDTADGADVHAGVVCMCREAHEDVLVFFGRIRGTDVTYLYPNVTVQRYDDAEKQFVHVHGYANEVVEAEKYVKDGYTYFICAFADPVPAEYMDLERTFQLVVNRESGSEDHEVEYVAGVVWG
ncbi:MAG: hypothetical protein E7474_13755 [Ruminococcaceae bacterium]|nr:hypothetical protein [Oscillospiraceae bacterium]